MYRPVTHLEYFRTLVADAEHIPLLEAAASIGQDADPALDLQTVLSAVDELGRELAERCRDASTELKRLRVLVDYFYRERGFAGNVENYYDPANSYLHRVLESRRGIPISLTVIFIELARTIGLDACGLGFPGHFLIRVNLHEGPVVLDPFTGRSLSLESLRARLAAVRSSDPLLADDEVPIELFLRPARPADILMRMLRNLREIHRQQGHAERLAQVVARIRILDPEAA